MASIDRKRSILTCGQFGTWFALTIALTVLSLRYAYYYGLSPTATGSEVKANNFDLWESAFQNPDSLKSAPLGAILVPIHRALSRLQNPENCAKASFFLYEYPYSPGLGAFLKLYTVAFYYAILSNRIFVLNDQKSFVWAEGCYGAQTAECFFIPLSRCSAKRVRDLVQSGSLEEVRITSKSREDGFRSKIIPVADPRKPSVVVFTHSAYSVSWYLSLGRRNDSSVVAAKLVPEPRTFEQEDLLSSEKLRKRYLQFSLSTYIMRLNEWTARKVAKGMMKVLTHYNLTATDHGKIIGVPVRKSDKCGTEMSCVSTTRALEYARRIASANPSITHVLLTSEDESAIGPGIENTGLGRFVRLKVMRNFLDVTPRSGAPRANLRKDRTKAQLMESILITLHLQAFPSFHVLTPISNFHALIVAQSKAMVGKNFDQYFPIDEWHDLRRQSEHTLVG